MKSLLKTLYLQFLMLILVLLCLPNCSATTAADKGRIIKASLDTSRAGCLVLLADASIPREPATADYCNRLLNAKIGVRLQALDEEVPSDPPVLSPGDCPPEPTP